MKKLSEQEIDNIYKKIIIYHKKYLKQFGVSLPNLKKKILLQKTLSH